MNESAVSVHLNSLIICFSPLYTPSLKKLNPRFNFADRIKRQNLSDACLMCDEKGKVCCLQKFVLICIHTVLAHYIYIVGLFFKLFVSYIYIADDHFLKRKRLKFQILIK